MDLRERIFFIALANVKGINFPIAKALIEKYGSAEAIFSTDSISLTDEFGEEHKVDLFSHLAKSCYNLQIMK